MLHSCASSLMENQTGVLQTAFLFFFFNKCHCVVWHLVRGFAPIYCLASFSGQYEAGEGATLARTGIKRRGKKRWSVGAGG